MEQALEPNVFVQLAPMMFMQLLFAGAAWWIAPKMGKNRWLWGGLFLIPALGMLFLMIFPLVVMGSILDKLNALSAREKDGAAR